MYCKTAFLSKRSDPKLRILKENLYLLLMGEYNITITFKPQGVDDPGVHNNQQSTRKETVDIIQNENNLLRPLLRIQAGVVFLHKMFIQEFRELDNQSDYPRIRNNHLQKMCNPHESESNIPEANRTLTLNPQLVEVRVEKARTLTDERV